MRWISSRRSPFPRVVPSAHRGGTKSPPRRRDATRKRGALVKAPIEGGSLVVRAYSPWRRVIIAIIVLILSGAAALFLLRVGTIRWRLRSPGGCAAASRARGGGRQLEKSNRELRTRLAELDTVRVGRAREQAEVARTIGELQAQVARQAQELAFYQGIVEQNSTPPLGVKIQQPRISQGEAAGTFRIRMALVRAGKPDDVVNGVIRLSVDGESNGTAADPQYVRADAGRTA